MDVCAITFQLDEVERKWRQTLGQAVSPWRLSEPYFAPCRCCLRTCLRSRELEPDKALRSNSQRLVKTAEEAQFTSCT